MRLTRTLPLPKSKGDLSIPAILGSYPDPSEPFESGGNLASSNTSSQHTDEEESDRVSCQCGKSSYYMYAPKTTIPSPPRCVSKRCPCFAASLDCSNCRCRFCENPNGINVEKKSPDSPPHSVTSTVTLRQNSPPSNESNLSQSTSTRISNPSLVSEKRKSKSRTPTTELPPANLKILLNENTTASPQPEPTSSDIHWVTYHFNKPTKSSFKEQSADKSS